VAGRHQDSLAQEEAVIVGLGDRRLRADVEQPAFSAIDASPHYVGTVRTDRDDRIRRRDVVASVLIGRVLEPRVRGEQICPVKRKGDATAH
jgi:hypothetical protein